MTDKFGNIYRIPSARWAEWDYSSNAAYFITICVANRAHDFGEIVQGEMCLTSLGWTAQACWEEIPSHFPFVDLGESVVMPNHVHGIVIIDKPEKSPVEAHENASPNHHASLHRTPRNRFGPQSRNLASIVRGYKIGVTRFARANNIPFACQSRYYDRVIRNADEYETITSYILGNPANWSEDELFGSER